MNGQRVINAVAIGIYVVAGVLFLDGTIPFATFGGALVGVILGWYILGRMRRDPLRCILLGHDPMVMELVDKPSEIFPNAICRRCDDLLDVHVDHATGDVSVMANLTHDGFDPRRTTP